MKSCVSFNT